MTIVNANRVRENTTGNGTGALALLGAVRNFQTFSAGVGNGNQCYYAITHQTANEWEVGLGTFTLSGGIPYLARNTVYSSSNGNTLVDFSSGTKQAAVVFPGTQIDTIASNVGVAAGYANDALTYSNLASTAAVNANIYRVSAAADASLAGVYAAAASASYVDAASAADRAVSAAAQVSSVAQEASLALVAASLAQLYKTSASAYATEAGGYASVAQIYKVSASAFATDAANQASIAGVYKASASAFATSAAADASAALVSRNQAESYSSIALIQSSLAAQYALSANNAASAASRDASLAAIYKTSANAAASVAQIYAEQASAANTSAAANASVAQIYAASASAAAVVANNAASVAGVYAASASAFASAASRDASLAFVYKTSASAYATSAAADASLALIYRTSASAYATQAADSASLAAYYASIIQASAFARLSSTQTFTGANTFASIVNLNGAVSVTDKDGFRTAINITSATPTSAGLVRLADVSAALAGTDTQRAVTPEASYAVMSRVQQNVQATTTYTLVSADIGRHILHPTSATAAATIIIPSSASVFFPLGAVITLINQVSAGTVTVSITSDTLVFANDGTTGNRTLAAPALATIIKVDTGQWMISGAGVT